MITDVNSRYRETLDKRIEDLNIDFQSNLEVFKRLLISGRVYTQEDPQDISIIPRVIKREEHRSIENMCSELTLTNFSVLSDYINNPESVPYSPLNDFIKSLPKTQKILSGMARYDFLKQEKDYKLVESNFVNAGALTESTGSAETLLYLFPELRKNFLSLAPVRSAKRRLEEREIKNVLLLTRDNYDDCPSEVTDRHLIKNTLFPIKGVIVPQLEYENISINGKVSFNGEDFDAIYPKHLSGSNGMEDELLNYHGFVSKLLKSNSLVFDNWLTILLEEKDLRFLSRKNSRIMKYLPEIKDITDSNNLDLSEWVLKLKDTHCGRGVVLSPSNVDISENGILQQRIFTNKHPVLSLGGKNGDATFDTGVYVSYTYDLEKRKLITSEVAGYLTRFSIESDIVNMTQGGGVIPTLIER
ncbi:MAG: hypothetical protein WC867_02220 [Candidatus Pacearchaeota archaeon]|jgi:hypothetical protein